MHANRLFRVASKISRGKGTIIRLTWSPCTRYSIITLRWNFDVNEQASTSSLFDQLQHFFFLDEKFLFPLPLLFFFLCNSVTRFVQYSIKGIKSKSFRSLKNENISFSRLRGCCSTVTFVLSISKKLRIYLKNRLFPLQIFDSFDTIDISRDYLPPYP